MLAGLAEQGEAGGLAPGRGQRGVAEPAAAALRRRRTSCRRRPGRRAPRRRACLTTVPSGTGSTRSCAVGAVAVAALARLAVGGPAVRAAVVVEQRGGARVDDERCTSPPWPPLPPSGPPSGLNFSRWTEAQPCPPSPAATCSTTRSTNVATAVTSSSRLMAERMRPSGRVPGTRAGARVTCRDLVVRLELVRVGRLVGRDDVDDLAAAAAAELDRAGGQREQRVVAAAADVGARGGSGCRAGGR